MFSAFVAFCGRLRACRGSRREQGVEATAAVVAAASSQRHIIYIYLLEVITFVRGQQTKCLACTPRWLMYAGGLLRLQGEEAIFACSLGTRQSIEQGCARKQSLSKGNSNEITLGHLLRIIKASIAPHGQRHDSITRGRCPSTACLHGNVRVCRAGVAFSTLSRP